MGRLKGSSPLARGLLNVNSEKRERMGIIPARAGSTQMRYLMCLLSQGSSPLARGLRFAEPARAHDHGIIPARAGSTEGLLRHLRQSPDHPRSRGVYRDRSDRLLRILGSSPLARGLRWMAEGRDSWTRIIPARAGSTSRFVSAFLMAKDHPRSRGVYFIEITPGKIRVGSSPLARGLLGHGSYVHTKSGIIPARAGSTSLHGGYECSAGDHPRSRGVYPILFTSASVNSGSSPLARGLLIIVQRKIHVIGIIPARAGSTDQSIIDSLDHQDHPRSRGVYSISIIACSSMAGSSPLARGLLFSSYLLAADAGIIPARAGSTCTRSPNRLASADHPRSRGVYRATYRSPSSTSGSSPLARGLPVERERARASRRDHPRSRGVYFPLLSISVVNSGSSPLARGLRRLRRRRQRFRRIIPARAGSTPRFPARTAPRQDHPRSRGVYCPSP